MSQQNKDFFAILKLYNKDDGDGDGNENVK